MTPGHVLRCSNPTPVTFRWRGRVRLSCHRELAAALTRGVLRSGWIGCVLERSVPTSAKRRFGLTGPRIAVWRLPAYRGDGPDGVGQLFTQEPKTLALDVA